MKVELFAILKQNAAADTVARQSIQGTFASLSDDVEPFLSFEDAKPFYAEMGKAFGRADVIVAAADEGAFLEQKWNMLKALGLKSEICSAVLQVIRENGNVPDAAMKAHALMPKDATVFLTRDGMFSGFALRSGKQTLVYLPMIDGKTQDILNKGVQPYFLALQEENKPKAAAETSAPQLDIPDNNERFIETAKILAECDVSVAFAATQTIRYVQNGVRANPLFGDAFIPATVEDDPSSRDSATERMACLADSARKEIGTTLGAAISNIYTVGSGSSDMFLHVALADSRTSHVRKITGLPGMTAADLVSLATDTLYTMLQDYAAGKEFPPEDADVTPINLFEDGMQSEQENKKQKHGTAIRILICVLIAVILCVLIGFYFKDEVAAFFDGTRGETSAMAAAALIKREEATIAEPLTVLEETTTEEFAADVDMALFGTAYTGGKTGIAALSAFETPVYVNFDTDIQAYTPPAEDVTYTTTPTTTTTTAAPTTTAATTTTTTTTTAPATTTTTKKAAQTAAQEASATTADAADKTETTTVKETAKSTTKVITAATTTKPATTTTTTTAPETTTQSLVDALFGTVKTDGTFTFTVYGYGHGVGMSQIGAIAYARQGWSYDAIVQHYYPGTTLTSETPPESITYAGKTRETKDFLVRAVQQEIGGTAKEADIEALKAQTVAVYSFMKAKGYVLSSGDVAYSTLADSSLSSVVRSAVDSVYGKYLSYGGKAALTTFYASSAGKTTSAKSVWGGSYAYLAGGVTSPETVSVSTVTISAADFKALIDRYNAANPSNPITLSGNPSQWIEILGHDGARGDVGYIATIRVGDKTMKGNTFRTMFNTYRGSNTAGLKSHCFSMQVS